MILNIGEYCVNIQKTASPEYWFYAVPTQGANLSNRSGKVEADSDEEAEQEVGRLLNGPFTFECNPQKYEGYTAVMSFTPTTLTRAADHELILAEIERNKKMDKKVRISFSDGTKWDIPVFVIAQNRANIYRSEFGNDVNRSLKEDTLHLFEDNSEILDWLCNNMDWKDVSMYAELATEPKEVNYAEEFCNAKKRVLSAK